MSSYDIVTSEVLLEKTTFDEEIFTADFTERLNRDGEDLTIDNIIGVSIVPSGEVTVDGTPTRDSTNKKLQFKLVGGVDDKKYIIRADIEALTSPTQRIRGEMILHVRDAKTPV